MMAVNRMSREILGNQKGLALLITITTLSLLVALTVQFHRATWQKFLVAHNYRVKNQLHITAESGVNIARAVIEADAEKNDADTLLDPWAVLNGEEFAGLFDTTSLELQVVDLSARIQVNRLAAKKISPGKTGEDPSAALQDALLALLLSGTFTIEDDLQAREIVDSLVDWVDSDDRESDLGAETSYYQSLDPPYECRNGPVQYIEELLLVKGITPKLLYGEKGEGGEEGTGGLADYLTVYGDDGKININTAPPALIQSLQPQLSSDILEEYQDFREETENEEELGSVHWYKNVRGWPGDLVLDENISAVSSSYFQVHSTGSFDSRSRRLVVDLQRTRDGEVVVLRRSVE